MNYNQNTPVSGNPKVDPKFGNGMISRKQRLQNDVFAKGDEGIASIIMALILSGVTGANEIRSKFAEMLGFQFNHAVDRALDERNGVSWYKDNCHDYLPIL